jgi:hypothetical protein
MPKQDVAVELFYDGAWHNLVTDDDVLADSDITINRGDGDESAAPRPASVSLRLANDDDRFRTSNPESPLYGRAGVNTPLRVSVGGVVRGYVEASSWRAGQTRDFRRYPRRGKAWVDVEGGGLLQRVNQWTEPLASPFRTYNDTLPTIGYWPMEQPRGSTTLVSSTPGTRQAVFQAMSVDSPQVPPGSAPLIDMNQDSSEVGGYFARNGAPTSTTGWQMSWVARYETFLSGPQSINDWATSDGSVWSLFINTAAGGTMNTFAATRAGVPIVDSTQSTDNYDFSQWTLFTVDAQYVAGTTTIWVNWTNFDGTEHNFTAAPYVGIPSSLNDWNMSVFAGVPSGSTVGHVIGTSTSSLTGADLFGTARQAAWFGHKGETAADRLTRLCALKGLTCSIIGTAALSTPMGAQGVDTLAGQLREIRDTEDGLIFDDADSVSLVFLLRTARYGQSVAAALAATDLVTLPPEVTDDLPIHNLVTVANRSGEEATAEDSTSPMGTGPPPTGRGEYRQTVDVNLSDVGDLGLWASWWLNRGTVDLPRFPQVTVNLGALDAGKVATINTIDVGSVITISGYREYLIRLFVLGWTEVIGNNARSITFICAPDRQFNPGVLDTARYDSASTVTAADYARGVASIVFQTTSANDLWSTVDAPYDCLCSGERFTVTAMGAAAGTGPYTQTATVARGVNGVNKVLPAGTEIHVFSPGRYAL